MTSNATRTKKFKTAPLSLQTAIDRLIEETEQTRQAQAKQPANITKVTL